MRHHQELEFPQLAEAVELVQAGQNQAPEEILGQVVEFLQTGLLLVKARLDKVMMVVLVLEVLVVLILLVAEAVKAQSAAMQVAILLETEVLEQIPQ